MTSIRGMLLLWASGFLPFLHFQAIQAGCSRGSVAQCEKAAFIPGHNLAGEGFDIITLQRKGAYVIDMESFLTSNGTCTLCKNSLLNHKVQKLPLNILDWRVDFRCSRSVISTAYESSMAFANSTSSHIENDWRIGLEVMPFTGVSVGVVTSGAHSKLSKFAMNQASRDKYSFSSQEVLCRQYRYRITDVPTLTPTFSARLMSLPTAYNAMTRQHFRSLIDTYGTHYIRQVMLGGRVREVTALKTCELALDQLTTDQVKDCLGVEAAVSIFGVKVQSEYNKCKVLQEKKLSKQRFSEKYSERKSEIVGGSSDAYTDLLFPSPNQTNPYKPWIESLKSMPDVSTYALVPLHELVPLENSTKALLRRAITDYIVERSIQKRCSICPVGTSPSQQVKCNCVCQPSSLLTRSCCTMERGLATMYVVVERAEGLKGDLWPNPPDGYVKVFYGNIQYRTHFVRDQYNPVWNSKFDFGTVVLSRLTELKIEVWDKDLKYDDHLGGCQKPATSGERRERCYLNSGNVRFIFSIQCRPHLTGPYCTEYQPSAN